MKGVATVMEIFRVLVSDASQVFDKTIEIHTYSAEEVGLKGSQDIAYAYQKQKVDVCSMVQFDMTGNTNGNPAIVTDYVDSALTAYLTTLAKQYTDLTWTTTKCGYGCSDHASWNKVGYRSAFPFETVFSKSNSKIHTNQDVLSRLDISRCK